MSKDKKPAVTFDEDEWNTSAVSKDSNGTVLAEGDSVVVIKDLPLKGGSGSIKRGTTYKNIKLTSTEGEVECRDGKNGAIVLKTCFLRKA